MIDQDIRRNLENDAVECSECGHEIEGHDLKGCGMREDGCPCTVRWTKADIRRVRKEYGLPSSPR